MWRAKNSLLKQFFQSIMIVNFIDDLKQLIENKQIVLIIDYKNKDHIKFYNEKIFLKVTKSLKYYLSHMNKNLKLF